MRYRAAQQGQDLHGVRRLETVHEIQTRIAVNNGQAVFPVGVRPDLVARLTILIVSLRRLNRAARPLGQSCLDKRAFKVSEWDM